jgi:hypothetical protein
LSCLVPKVSPKRNARKKSRGGHGQRNGDEGDEMHEEIKRPKLNNMFEEYKNR